MQDLVAWVRRQPVTSSLPPRLETGNARPRPVDPDRPNGAQIRQSTPAPLCTYAKASHWTNPVLCCCLLNPSPPRSAALPAVSGLLDPSLPGGGPRIGKFICPP